jgi:hypothetical protein
VLASPRVQLVAFANDPQAASLQNFLLAWAGSTAWSEATGEYGVGPLEVLPMVAGGISWASSVSNGVRTGNPNTDIEAALIASLDGPQPRWGAPDPNTVYVMSMPQGVAVAPSAGAAAACDANLMAWHGALTLPQSKATVAYVVVPSCGASSGLSVLDSKTYALSHALVDTVTDPAGAGFAALDSAHAAWQLVAESPEAGALCTQAMYANPNVLVHRVDVPQALARTWSNAAAASGHVPCVPAINDEIYLTATADVADTIDVALGPDPDTVSGSTVGLRLAAGTSDTIDVLLTSVPATLGAFDVTATEVGSADLALTLKSTRGQHGDALALTVAVRAAPKSRQQVVRLTSRLGEAAFSQYFLVRQP